MYSIVYLFWSHNSWGAFKFTRSITGKPASGRASCRLEIAPNYFNTTHTHAHTHGPRTEEQKCTPVVVNLCIILGAISAVSTISTVAFFLGLYSTISTRRTHTHIHTYIYTHIHGPHAKEQKCTPAVVNLYIILGAEFQIINGQFDDKNVPSSVVLK